MFEGIPWILTDFKRKRKMRNLSLDSPIPLHHISSLCMLQSTPFCPLCDSDDINPLVSRFCSGSHDGSRSADDLLHSWYWWHCGPHGTKETEGTGWRHGLEWFLCILICASEVLDDLSCLLLWGCESFLWSVFIWITCVWFFVVFVIWKWFVQELLHSETSSINHIW